MKSLSEIKEFFNDFSLSTFEELETINCEEIISSKLKSLEAIFEKDIEEFKTFSIGNKTRTALLNSIDDNVEFILKGVVDVSSLKTQTEYINYWISKSILCQKTIILLGNYLKRRCYSFQHRWKEYQENNNNRRLFNDINHLYGLIYGICQNIGIAIDDYSGLSGIIRSNISIKEVDFRPPYTENQELKVSERISQINTEAENCLLLVNRTESMLGFSAVRIALESYIIIKIGSKLRQHIRKETRTDNVDIRFTSKLKTDDVFWMIRELFPKQKEYEALYKIYSLSSNTIHKALSQPNYLSWACLYFSMDELEKMIDNLSIDDPKLKELTKELLDGEKLCIF